MNQRVWNVSIDDVQCCKEYEKILILFRIIFVGRYVCVTLDNCTNRGMRKGRKDGHLEYNAIMMCTHVQ